jgi:hypothetical protein
LCCSQTRSVRLLRRLLVAIHTVRPHLALRARAVIEAIVLAKGSIGSAAEVAGVLGLKNRFRLAGLLKREGLPPLHRLTKWITVLSWVDSAERRGVSLCSMAFHSRRDPSACYRLVKAVTGRNWEHVRLKGGAWVLRQFLKEVRALKLS